MPSNKPTPAPFDTNVVMPQAVMRESARSDAIHKQVYETPADDPATPQPAEPPAFDAPKPQEPPPPAPVATVLETAPPGQDSWEHRYKTMKGRYDQVANQQTQLMGKVNALEEVISNFQAVTPATPHTPPELAAASLVTPEEVANYGEEFLDVVARRALQAVQPKIDKLETENAELNRRLGNVAGTVTASAQEQMFANLDKELPSWREVNLNQQFLSWLALQDPYSGVIRQKLLTNAFGRNDSARVLSFFRGFLTEEAAVAPAPAPIIAPATGGTDLGALAAPGRARSAPPAQGGGAEKPIITRAQIASFYADVRAGKYDVSKEAAAEKVRLEKMIFDAQAERRVR